MTLLEVERTLNKICKLRRYIARILLWGFYNWTIGMNGSLISPAPAQDTMRLNGADATYIGDSIVELLSGQTPKGDVGSSTL